MKKILSFLLIIIGLCGYSQDEYYRKVDWKFYPDNVVQLTDSTYLTDAIPFDYNDPASIRRVIGNYVVDYVGHRYSVIDSTSTTITVLDIYHIGQAPQTGQIARCYRSVGDGEAEYIGSIDYSPLDESSRWKLNGSDNELLWRQTLGKAENGLYKDLRTAKLGGNLIEPTTINQDNNSFKILDNGHGSVFSETGIAYTKIDTVDFTDSTLVTKMYVKSLIKEGTSHDSLTIAAGSTSYFDVNYPQIFSGQKLIDSLGVMNTRIDGKEPAFSKNTAFNKNFGTTTNTVLEGRTFGTAADEDINNIMSFKGTLLDNSDANSLIDGYYLNLTGNGTGNTNYPALGDYGGYGVMSMFDAGYFKFQFLGVNDGTLLTRGSEGSSWSSWRKIWDSGNANLPTVPWDASQYKLSGVDLYSSLTANTLQKWDGAKHTSIANSSGYLYNDGSGNMSWIKTVPQSLSGTTPTLNASNGVNANLSISGATTLTLSNLISGTSGTIYLTNNASVYRIKIAGYTIAPASNITYDSTGILLPASSVYTHTSIGWYYNGTTVQIHKADYNSITY